MITKLLNSNFERQGRRLNASEQADRSASSVGLHIRKHMCKIPAQKIKKYLAWHDLLVL